MTKIKKVLSKEVIAIIVVGLTFHILFFGYDAFDYIYAATVNEIDGTCAYVLKKDDVEIHIFDLNESTNNVICLGDEYTKGGVATIWFDETYQVYCYRSDLCLSLDSDGNIISINKMTDQEVPETWSKWEKQSNAYTYIWNGYEYRYYKSNYLKSRFLGDEKYLSLSDDVGNIIYIWKTGGCTKLLENND